MFKKLIAAFFAFLAFSVSAADVNTASQAELESVKGIGPAIATKIVDERKNGTFKDWPDLVNRVKGIGNTSAGKLSAQGLTVNGATYAGATTGSKNDAPAVAKTSAAAPAAASSMAKPRIGTLVKSSTIASAPAETSSSNDKAGKKAAKKASATAASAASK